MSTSIEGIMTRHPVLLRDDATVAEAARMMRDHDIGDVLVTRYDKMAGLVTDRDITIRAVAAGLDPQTTPLVAILSPDPVCVAPSDEPAYALALMRSHALRRLPVCDGDRVVGIVSLGDLTGATDTAGALAEISTAPANH